MILLSLSISFFSCSLLKQEDGFSVEIPIESVLFASWSNNAWFFLYKESKKSLEDSLISISDSTDELADLIMGKNKPLTDKFIEFINRQADSRLIAKKMTVDRNSISINYSDESYILWNYYLREEPLLYVRVNTSDGSVEYEMKK